MDSISASAQKTIQNIIDETIAQSSTRNTGELGKDDFLNLLVTQLRYQDPLNPTNDKEFIGQMAQFSALEQMQNLNTSFTATKAYSLIGKNIRANVKDKITGETEVISGDVTAVKTSLGKYYVVVRGVEVAVDMITDVTDNLYSERDNLSLYTNLIGFEVKGIVYNPDDGDMIGVSGIVRSIQKGLYEDYAVMDRVRAVITGLNDGFDTTDPDYLREALTMAYESGEELTVIIKDDNTGKKVPVTARLTDLNISDSGKITAILNGVHVPLESITAITGAEEGDGDDH